MSELCQLNREVKRCPNCELVQFMTKDCLCRRCHKVLTPTQSMAPYVIQSSPPAIMHRHGLDVSLALVLLRKAHGHSQREMADVFGIPRTYFSKIENGHCLPTIKQCQRLAAIYQLSMEEFINLVERLSVVREAKAS